MIPKVIHYCWFGGNPLPESYQNYINSWKKFSPDFEIKRWDETNFDVTKNKYCQEAFEAKQWAFVSDYARLEIIYNYGGVYLDTDIELLKDITPLIQDNIGFIGFQNPMEATTGLGFAAEAKNECVKAMLDVYSNRKFKLGENLYNKVPCPAANTVGLMKYGLKIGKKHSQTIQILPGIKVYPQEYFNPLNADTQEINITLNTYMIHHYAASWFSNNAKNKQLLKRLIPNFILNNRVIRISKRDIERIQNEIKQGRSNE
ncbi:glycosyltransferase family 32 protein [Streptococcus uberis]|uniref:glycosyltransferase family 32 protein n=1 Tax=Streptococcus uberis TaxID=1349 RepID=UPI0012B57766|nr:glycosyltransferase [Streptococcus uberis]MBI0907066.1 glycosyl transferase [Streptococcus uberis]MBY4764397.1 glycosyl transferase [Streptococcus uberis]MCK1168440.1 glycosyl transferase [Streptococcus uberis]MCK1187110.1 glycosyl transferase [Streptococcus uberis]MCK1194881.1 glycosyl transferase [Streptococcus uberis]